MYPVKSGMGWVMSKNNVKGESEKHGTIASFIAYHRWAWSKWGSE
jgi:hypothetical protein